MNKKVYKQYGLFERETHFYKIQGMEMYGNIHLFHFSKKTVYFSGSLFYLYIEILYGMLAFQAILKVFSVNKIIIHNGIFKRL